MNTDYYRATTLFGGAVDVTLRTENSSGYLPDFPVVRLDHEDGFLEFTEEEALNLIGALTHRLNEVSRARWRASLDNWTTPGPAEEG